MTASQRLNAFAALCEKHFAEVKREQNILFPTRAEHDAMVKMARIRAIREQAAA